MHTHCHTPREKPKTFLICIYIFSSCLPLVLTHVKERNTHEVVTSFTFKPFIPSFGLCDSVALALAARMSPFHLNRSFTRCCAINDWLPLRKAEGKTPALLVLQCRRLSGVQYYSNHSVEVSRALSGMFRDWHLPASFTDFTVQLWQIVLHNNPQRLHKLLSYKTEEMSRGSDTWNEHRCRGSFWGFAQSKCFVANFAAELSEREKAEEWKAGLTVLCKVVFAAAILTHHLLWWLWLQSSKNSARAGNLPLGPLASALHAST